MDGDRLTEAQRYIEELEATWELSVSGLPVWWFARMHFFGAMAASEGDVPANETPLRSAFSGSLRVPIRESVSRAAVFGLRSAVGRFRFGRAKRAGHCDVLLLSEAGLFRNLSRKQGFGDAVLGQLASQGSGSTVTLERPMNNGTGPELDSLRGRRDGVFTDFFLLRALLESMSPLLRRPLLFGWERFREAIEAGGFPEEVEEMLVSKALQAINAVAGKALLEVAAACRVLDTCRPRVLALTTSYDGFPRAFIYAAHTRGIPVVELQHGIIHPLHRGYLYFFPGSVPHNAGLPDRLLVHGERFRDLLVSQGEGFPPNTLRVVGNIRLAEYLARLTDRTAVTPWVHRRLHVPQGHSLLTVSCQPDSRSFLISCLRPALADLAKHRVVVCLKPHPSEVPKAREAYRLLLRCPNVRLVTDSGVSLYDLLIASRLHATVASTVLLECLCLGVPNVLIRGPLHEGLLRLLGQDADLLPLVESTEELLIAARTLTSDSGERQAAIQRGIALGTGFFLSDAKVTCRTRKEIEECALRDS